MFTDNPYVTFTAGQTLAINRRVKLSAAGIVVYAQANDDTLGVTALPAASGSPVNVRLFNGPGTFEITAAGAIAAGVACFGAADGKVAASGTLALGTTNEAATAAGDEIEIIPVRSNDTPGAVLGGAADGLGALRVARATFDATGGKAVAAYGLGVTLPDKAIVIGGVVQVNTAFTSAAGTATIALSVQTANDLVAAAAVSGAPYATTGLKPLVPKSNTPESTGIALTAPREVTATVAVQALTAGKATVFIHYVIGA